MKLTITTNEYEILKVPFESDTVIIVHDFDVTLLNTYKKLTKENTRLQEEIMTLALEFDEYRNTTL